MALTRETRLCTDSALSKQEGMSNSDALCPPEPVDKHCPPVTHLYFAAVPAFKEVSDLRQAVAFKRLLLLCGVEPQIETGFRKHSGLKIKTWRLLVVVLNHHERTGMKPNCLDVSQTLQTWTVAVGLKPLAEQSFKTWSRKKPYYSWLWNLLSKRASFPLL